MSQNEGSAKEILGYAFLYAFANDGTIDAEELAFIEKLALRDKQIDDGERNILSQMFKRAKAHQMAPEVRAEIARFKEEYEIP